MKAYQEYRKYNNDIPIHVNFGSSMDFLAHWHTDIELIYMLKGSHTIGINQEVYTLEPEDFAICTSGDIHFYTKTSEYAEYILLIFNPDFIGYSSGWPRNKSFIEPYISKKALQTIDQLSATNKVRNILEELLTENKKRLPYSSDAVKSLLLELCVVLLRNFPTVESAEGANFKKYNLQRMHDTLTYLETNFTSNISLSELASISNLSKFHFSRLFSKTVGMSFKDYINRKRIEKAKALLKEGTLSVTEIAYDCGFESIRTFNRVFKATNGVAPSMFK